MFFTFDSGREGGATSGCPRGGGRGQEHGQRRHWHRTCTAIASEFGYFISFSYSEYNTK